VTGSNGPTIEPIGVVVSPVREGRDEGWGGIVSEIRIAPRFAEGLQGLEQFSHVVVVFLMHEATFDPAAHLARRPRDRDDMPRLGIFAQRAKHRPNPIGLTTVRIERVEGASVFVRGLDAIDGSPVLDLKPHAPVFDAPAGASTPEWFGRLMAGYF